jgi:RNA polymerase sigma-70 factor, ECF subfamily
MHMAGGKGWLSRALASMALRGEEPPSVDAARFQGPEDPFPGHWREFPARWPRIDPADPAVRARLRAAVGELPETWQAVVRLRDVRGRPPAELTENLELTAAQQRAMLNRARAFLRERLALFLNRAPGQ